tara:strand:- start:1100 stop:1474 length:375 start_codon:yes stop_codon:yes gene_type:complete
MSCIECKYLFGWVPDDPRPWGEPPCSPDNPADTWVYKCTKYGKEFGTQVVQLACCKEDKGEGLRPRQQIQCHEGGYQVLGVEECSGEMELALSVVHEDVEYKISVYISQEMLKIINKQMEDFHK